MYDHRQSFVRSNWYERLVLEDEFDNRTFRTDLGWCDEDLFNEALRQFDDLGSGKGGGGGGGAGGRRPFLPRC